jgi:hypothetical protein
MKRGQWQVGIFGVSFFCMMLLVQYSPLTLWAHVEKKAAPPRADKLQKENEALRKKKFAELALISQEYVRSVKPIFVKKCGDCHGLEPRYPWYYLLPGAKQLIDHDIEKGRNHLDISIDFPFKGHGTPASDLEALKKTIEEGSMPPLRYLLVHWDKRLTTEDKKIFMKWYQMSRALLEIK